MIEDPYALARIVYCDWDNTLLGVLYFPRALKDARLLVNIFVESNMVHPDLRSSQWGGHKDPWAEERNMKFSQAKHDWPRRRVIPVETMIPEMTEDGKIRVREDGTIHFHHHDLSYIPIDYKKQTGAARRQSFRPEKGA